MKHWIKIILVIGFSYCCIAAYAQNKKVGCVGDSVTKGYGIKSKGKSYPEQLQLKLGTGYEVQNFGHSGATLLSRGHNPYVLTQEFKNALVYAPDILVIALGLNDTDPRNWPNYGSDFVADYSGLIDRFKEVNPQVEVYICKMTPIFSGHKRFLSGTRDWFNQIQELIPEIARANGAKLIDNYTPLANRMDLFEDFLHPDEHGARILATTVYHSLVGTKLPLSVDVTLGNDMVLQRGKPNNIFGKGTTGETVKIAFEGKDYTCKVDQCGNWALELPSMLAGGPYKLSVKMAKEEILLSGVWFGDVYLASGQSNMAFPLHSALRGKELVEKASDDTPIRLFKYKNLVETQHVAWDSLTLEQINEGTFFSGAWQKPSAKSAGEFSAIAYAFAAQVSAEQGIPIGIVEVAVGGANTESWIPMRTLEMDDLLATYIDSWRTSDFIQDFCRERARKNLALTKNKNQAHPYAPAYNFENGIANWLSTNFKGVLWYQGESNAHNVELHAYLFTKLVSAWRKEFAQDFPFYVVQLSSLERPSWPAFRDSQRKLASALSNVHLAVSSDLGDANDVHPREKIIIGQRLASLASKYSYGKDVQADTPEPVDVILRGTELVLSFDACEVLKTKGGKALQDIVLLDMKGKELEINKIRMEGNKLFISFETGVLSAIRYGYSPFTRANLESEAAVPVSTFNIKIN